MTDYVYNHRIDRKMCGMNLKTPRVEHFSQMCIEGLTEWDWDALPPEIQDKFRDASAAFIAWADERDRVVQGTLVQEVEHG